MQCVVYWGPQSPGSGASDHLAPALPACCANVRWFCSHHLLWLSEKRWHLWWECFLCAFLQCLRFGAVVFNLGLFACFRWVARRASDKYIHNYLYILYFVHRTTSCHTQNNGITWQ